MTFIEAILHKIQETHDPDDPIYGQRGELNLSSVLLDLFIAGSETSSTTMNWAMLYMILNPEIQTRVQKELENKDANTHGLHKKASDRNLTPYTEAVICEIQRKGNILPNSVFHRTLSELKLKNYIIPPDTVIVPMIGDIMHDPDYFHEPMTFNPQRYLINENGKLKGNYYNLYDGGH